MSLLHRKPRPLAPEERSFRDDQLIVVVTEDTYAPEQYFALVKARRVHVRVAAAQGGHSSPQAILQSARALKDDADFKDHDEFWLLLDTDHWADPGHIHNFLGAISTAKQEGFKVAVSNPCFDLWLLLHHAVVAAEMPFNSCEAVGKTLRSELGEFNKKRLNREHFTVPLAKEAIRRARTLTPDLNNYQPPDPGTQVWALVEVALADVLGKPGH